jgi:hypothetical protein
MEKAKMTHDLIFWKKLVTDMVVALGNDPYMAATAMESWVKKMADTEDQKELLELVDDIENRLLTIKPHEWNG